MNSTKKYNFWEFIDVWVQIRAKMVSVFIWIQLIKVFLWTVRASKKVYVYINRSR
jgi:hypothetical protein